MPLSTIQSTTPSRLACSHASFLPSSETPPSSAGFLVNNIKQRRGVNGSYGAVEGILAASALYTLIAMLLGCIKKNSSPGSHKLRWIWVLLDLAFVGAFIAVAVLTRPDDGPAGPKHCYAGRSITDFSSINNATGANADSDDTTCNLPWVTFILAIIST
jgi:hypothetical protein